MGNTVLWYYPEGSGAAKRIDFGRRLVTRKGPTTVFRQSVSESIVGVANSVIHSGRDQISLVHKWTGLETLSRTLRRKLWTLQNHLQRGGYVVVAEDEDYAFAGFATKTTPMGDRLFSVNGNLFENLVSGVNATGRECVIHSDFGSFKAEMSLINSHNVATNFLQLPTDGCTFDYTGSDWQLIRELGTYPAMRLPVDMRNDEFLTHDNEIINHLELPLETDPSVVDSLARTSLILPGETASGGIDPNNLPIEWPTPVPAPGGWY